MLAIRALAASALRTTADWIVRRGAAAGPAYDAGGFGRRTRDWLPTSETINAILFTSAETLRARSRDMARKSPWAGAALDTWQANVIGTGIKPQSLHPEAAFRRALQETWLAWTDESDADDVTDYYGQQGLAARAVKEGGEVFARFRNRRPEDGLTVPLQIQLLEPEHVPMELNQPLPGGGAVRAGIEFDARGRRVAYHMTRNHPGDTVLTARGHELVRVPASEIMHVFAPLRPGQIRGTPGLATALLRIFDFDHYEDAELVRKRDSAMFSGFIEEPLPTGPDGGPMAAQKTETDAAGVQT